MATKADEVLDSKSVMFSSFQAWDLKGSNDLSGLALPYIICTLRLGNSILGLGQIKDPEKEALAA